MSLLPGTLGHRLIPSVIDYYAAEAPDKIYASVPRSEDLSKGFTDVTYKQLANAIDHASWWLDSELGQSNQSFETFAYSGPKDLQYPVLAVAAAKVGRTILLPSSFVTAETQIHLLDATESYNYLCSKFNKADIESIVERRPDTRVLQTPDLLNWISVPCEQRYEYTKRWDTARNDPWIVFHSSGTTGLPKPIVYTHSMMTSFEASLMMPEASQELLTHHFMGERWYSPLPSLHAVGMLMVLQLPVLLDMIIVLGQANQPATATSIDQILKLGNLTGMMVPPSFLEDLCRDADMLERVRALKYVHYVGAPLDKGVGDLLWGHVKLLSAIGSTEAGFYFQQYHGEPEWYYHHFCPSMGLTFETRADDLYEAVFCRKAGLERWQQIFTVYPNLERFPTNDLMTRHRTNPDLWAYAGRTDDLISFSHSNSYRVSGIEAAIMSHPDVQAAVVGGDGRARPFLILDVRRDRIPAGVGQHDIDLIEHVWPVVNEANEKCKEMVRLKKELTILVAPDKPIERTAKGTVSRRAAIELYKNEVDEAYKRSG